MKTNRNSLQTYLTGLGSIAVLASTSNAAVIPIDVSAVSGINGGLSAGTSGYFNLFSINGLNAQLELRNNDVKGIAGAFAIDGASYIYGNVAWTGSGKASPQRFERGDTIDEAVSFSSSGADTGFESNFNGLFRAPEWGEGSFLGFQVAGFPGEDYANPNIYYGWVEVTWDPAAGEFQILSAAYEDTVGLGITIDAIPEPSSLALLAAGVGGVAALRRRKKAG